jgi:hypothetical protein
MSSLKEMQDHLVELDTFIGSRLHQHYVTARETEIETVKEAILMTPPISDENSAIVLMLHGELKTLSDLTKTFEDARVTLKARIDVELERENQNATDQKV